MLESFFAEGLGEPACKSQTVKFDRAAPVTRIFENPAQRVKIQWVVQRRRLHCDAIARMDRESGEGHDIVKIVCENPFQGRAGPALHVIEIRLRNHRSGYIAWPQEREHLTFEGDQAATAVSVPPQPPRRKQKIEMSHAMEWTVEPRKRPSSLQQWQIERGAIVGNDKIKAPQTLAQRRKHGGLFIEVPDEVLAHVKLVANEVADTRQEGTHSGTALDAGCLCVQKNDAFARWNTSVLPHHRNQRRQ